MASQWHEPQEEALWQAKEAATAQYEALRAERKALDTVLTRWRDLVARQAQSKHALAAADDEAEQATPRW